MLTPRPRPSASAIVWSDGTVTPLADSFAFGDANQTLWPRRILWSDGSTSYAKGWRFAWGAGGYPMQRIGAGAYGDATILYRSSRESKPSLGERG
jgi:hypothetical protein